MSTQLRKVAKVLRKHTSYPGISASQIAKAAGVPTDSVRKRIYDLRTNEGRTIYSNPKTVKGVRTTFYRFVA
jgi:DNA-binding Lrp family transcriptional regulator